MAPLPHQSHAVLSNGVEAGRSGPARTRHALPQANRHSQSSDPKGINDSSEADIQSYDADPLVDSLEAGAPHKAEEEETVMQARYQPMVTIDWRGEICKLLNLSAECSNQEVFGGLQEASDKLAEVERLRALTLSQSGPPRSEVIHLVSCHEAGGQEPISYLEEPHVVERGPRHAHLTGGRVIHNHGLFLEQTSAVFLVRRHYECCKTNDPYPQKTGIGNIMMDTDTKPKAADFLVAEVVTHISPKLRSAFISIAETALQGCPHPDFQTSRYGEEELRLPYLWWFHRRDLIEAAADSLDRDSQEHLEVFKGYLRNSLGRDWDAADELISRGMITSQLIEYIFIPGDVVISTLNGSSISTLEAYTISNNLKKQRIRNSQISGSLEVTSWGFGGHFFTVENHLRLDAFERTTDELVIPDLAIYPMKFATSSVVAGLYERGKMFWKCRFRNYVSYTASSENDTDITGDARFMVDFKTYRGVHRENKAISSIPDSDDIGPETMSLSDPPLDDTFFMCLPPTLIGFSMEKKEWVTLKVALMKDVEWNTEAFEFLVMGPARKELVQAVVMNQIQSEQGTDLIRSKGNGLFILLHGGPGTGKTLTAESVAEVARKPLYRVTCGDMGTKAEDVENYFEGILTLGRSWDCVVLLDEADVFLEQRSLANLERNALVSAFLRILEYYDGILILTSNRVGTFDEAFKSRINLNIRYDNLDEDQRRKIWENFLSRLERLDKSARAERNSQAGFGIDVEGIRANLSSLARPELNGREIRNAISTARQLAMYRREKLGYDHLCRVIDEVEQFDTYLKKVRRGFSMDQIQRDKAER